MSDTSIKCFEFYLFQHLKNNKYQIINIENIAIYLIVNEKILYYNK